MGSEHTTMFFLKPHFLVLFFLVLVSFVQSFCKIPTKSYQDCQELCKSRNDCRRWEYSSGFCYLKNRWGWTSRYSPGSYSGFSRPILREGYDILRDTQSYGADLTCTHQHIKNLCLMNVKDASNCQKACQHVTNCGRWEFKTLIKNGFNCYLKSEYGWTAKQLSNHISGYKYGQFKETTQSDGGDLSCDTVNM